MFLSNSLSPLSIYCCLYIHFQHLCFCRILLHLHLFVAASISNSDMHVSVEFSSASIYLLLPLYLFLTCVFLSNHCLPPSIYCCLYSHSQMFVFPLNSSQLQSIYFRLYTYCKCSLCISFDIIFTNVASCHSFIILYTVGFICCSTYIRFDTFVIYGHF